MAKLTKLNLIEFTNYDNKDYLTVENEKGEFITYNLTEEEKLALLHVEIMKNETSYMCRYDTPNGGVQYELAKDKRNRMHKICVYSGIIHNPLSKISFN